MNEYIANRFRIAHNLFSIVAIGGMYSALFIPTIITIFVGSELGGKIFMSRIENPMIYHVVVADITIFNS